MCIVLNFVRNHIHFWIIIVHDTSMYKCRRFFTLLYLFVFFFYLRIAFSEYFDSFAISYLFKKPRATRKSLRPCPSPVKLFLLWSCEILVRVYIIKIDYIWKCKSWRVFFQCKPFDIKKRKKKREKDNTMYMCKRKCKDN